MSPRLPDVPTPSVAAPQEPDALPTHTLTVINGQSSTRAVFQLSDKAGPTGTNVEKSQPESPPNPKKAAPGPAEKPTAGK